SSTTSPAVNVAVAVTMSIHPRHRGPRLRQGAQRAVKILAPELAHAGAILFGVVAHQGHADHVGVGELHAIAVRVGHARRRVLAIDLDPAEARPELRERKGTSGGGAHAEACAERAAPSSASSGWACPSVRLVHGK